MSVITDFWKAIQGKLLGGKTYEVSSADLEDFISREDWNRLALYDLALHSGIRIISNALSKCEFRTFLNGKEVKGDEYYLWNYEPNRNENASQFLQKLVATLVYRNECLVVSSNSGELLVAESYNHERYAFFPDRFSNVTVCTDGQHPYTFQRTFRMDEVLFYKLNNSNIRELLDQLSTEYNELMQSAIQKFYKSGGERGVLNIDANAPTKNYGTKPDGTPRTFNDVYTEMMNRQFAQYFKSPNAVMTLWSGFDYEQKAGETSRKSTSEVKDIRDLADEIYERVANALMIPPMLLKGDVADVREPTKNLLTFGIDPIAKLIERENNRKRNGKAVLEGTYQMLDTSMIRFVDVFDIAEKADKVIADGILSVDEVRRKVREPEIGEPWSQEHFMTLNYISMQKAGSDQPEPDEQGSGPDPPDSEKEADENEN